MTDFKPRVYQGKMIDFAHANRKVGLFADPGLGKTVTALSVILDSLYDYADTGRWLIVGPKRVVERVWRTERDKWQHLTGLSIGMITGADLDLHPPFKNGKRQKFESDDELFVDKRATKKRLLARTESVLLVSYDFVYMAVKALGTTVMFNGVILDESDSVKNPSSKRFRAARQLAKGADRFLLLTGTPNPNGYEDLWTQIYLLDKGQRLGESMTAYRERFFRPDQRGRDGTVYNWKLRKGAKEEIDKLIGEVCISLSSDDWLNLPERIENDIVVTLPPAAHDALYRLENELVVELDKGGTVYAGSGGVLFGKMRQICNGAVFDDNGKVNIVHDAKIEALKEFVDTYNGNILCAIHYQHDADRIVKAIKVARRLNNNEALDAFERGEIKLGLLHPESGGAGLDGLQHGADCVLWFGPTENLRHKIQFEARIRRHGSKASRVVIHTLVADHKFDTVVMPSLLKDKTLDLKGLLTAIK